MAYVATWVQSQTYPTNKFVREKLCEYTVKTVSEARLELTNLEATLAKVRTMYINHPILLRKSAHECREKIKEARDQIGQMNRWLDQARKMQ